MSISKSASDRRSYEYFELPSGLRCIVAQDPDASSQAAVALTVLAGSLHEPKEIPGLAHLCEHMVLHGTFSPRFVDPPFAAYVKQNGGSHNGVTTMQQTCFAFEIRPDRLEGALDRFSHFFISPSFSRGNIAAEIKSMDSEHSMNLQNDFRRLWAVLLLDANPRHPYHWGSGNQKSLQKCPFLFEALIDFHKARYCASCMALAVVSTQDTRMLTHMVRRLFGPVSGSRCSKPVIGDEVGGEEPPFLSEDFRGQVFLVPVKDSRQLRLSWLLPWQVSRWRCKPTTYLAYILDHEVCGSLQSILKSRGHITALKAACFDYHGCGSTFEISVDLTERAMQDDVIIEVGTLIFAYLCMLRNADIEPWIFEELCQLQELDFDYHYDTTAYSLAQDLACNLHYYPSAEVLKADHLVYDFNPALLGETLQTLRVKEARLWLVAQEFSDRCTSVEPWYGAKFAKCRSIEKKFEDAWLAVERGGWKGIVQSYRLKFPAPNCFLPNDLSVLADPKEEPPTSLVELPSQHSWCRAWYRRGGTMRQPKAAISFYIHSSFTAAGCREAALTHMFCCIIQAQLEERCSYEARAAGLMYKLERSETGIVLQFLGFNDRLHILASALIKQIVEFGGVSDITWSLVHDEQERLLGNMAQRSHAYSQAVAAWESMTIAPRWAATDFHKAIKEMKPIDLEGIGRNLFGKCLVEALLIGNITADSAGALLHTIVDPIGRFLFEPTSTQVPPRTEVVLPRSVPLTMLVFDGTDPEDPNSCAFMSIGNLAETTPENEALVMLLTRIMKPMFFTEIRTKQQLGYVVTCFMRARVRYISLNFLVQTERPPEVARRAMENFLEIAWKHISESLTASEFRDYCSSTLRQLLEEPRNLWETLQRYWLPIEDRTLAFDTRQRQIEYLESCTLAMFRRFVEQTAWTAPKLCVLVRSRKNATVLPPAGAERTAKRVYRGGGMTEFRDSLEHKGINIDWWPNAPKAACNTNKIDDDGNDDTHSTASPLEGVGDPFFDFDALDDHL